MIDTNMQQSYWIIFRHILWCCYLCLTCFLDGIDLAPWALGCILLKVLKVHQTTQHCFPFRFLFWLKVKGFLGMFSLRKNCFQNHYRYSMLAARICVPVKQMDIMNHVQHMWVKPIYIYAYIYLYIISLQYPYSVIFNPYPCFWLGSLYWEGFSSSFAMGYQPTWNPVYSIWLLNPSNIMMIFINIPYHQTRV